MAKSVKDVSGIKCKVCVRYGPKSANFREAADRLGMAQSSITNRMKSLEAQLSTPLFAIEGKKKVLTPFGIRIVNIAEESLTALSIRLDEANKMYSTSENVLLRVGCRPEVFSYIAPQLPNSNTYEFLAMTGAEVGPAILNGDIDLGFSAIVPDSHNLISKKTLKSRVKICVHKEFLKNKQSKYLWDDPRFLKEVPSLFYQKDGHLLYELCNYHKIKLDDLNPKFIGDSWYMLTELVNKKMGYAVMPWYVNTSPDIYTEEIPNKVCTHLNFYLLVKSAYRKVTLFQDLLKNEWL